MSAHYYVSSTSPEGKYFSTVASVHREDEFYRATEKKLGVGDPQFTPHEAIHKLFESSGYAIRCLRWLSGSI